MSFQSIVADFQKAGVKGRSQSYQDVYTKLLNFDNKLKQMPDNEEKVYHFDSNEMASLYSSCYQYLNSHHPITKKGKEQREQIRQLAEVLNNMSEAGKTLKSFDKKVQEEITEPLESGKENSNAIMDRITGLQAEEGRRLDESMEKGLGANGYDVKIDSPLHDLSGKRRAHQIGLYNELNAMLTIEDAKDLWAKSRGGKDCTKDADQITTEWREKGIDKADKRFEQKYGPLQNSDKAKVRTNFNKMAGLSAKKENARSKAAQDLAKTQTATVKKAPAGPAKK